MPIPHRLAARTAVVIAALIGAVMLSLSIAPPASAAPSHRFWGYFQLKGSSWEFAQKGADQMKPADGSVEGWRFALAGQTDTRTPRDTVTFKEICQDTKAKEGTKRVGVVLDFGRTADAESGKPPQPTMACAQVPTAATGAEVLAKVAPVRAEKGMTCGILNWPAKGCGGEVKDVPAAAKAKDKPVQITAQLGSSGASPTDPQAAAKQQPNADEEEGEEGEEGEEEEGSSAPVFIGVGVVIVLILGASTLVAKRRRKDIESA